MRKVGLGVLLFLLLLLSGFAWLIASESGLRFLAGSAQRLAGGAVEIRHVRGRLIGPLSLAHLRVRWDGGELLLDNADMNWTPMAALWAKPLALSLDVQSLQLRTRDTEDAPAATSGTPALPDSWLPFVLQLDALRLAELRWYHNEELRAEVRELSLQAETEAEILHIRALSLRHEQTGELKLTAKLRSEPPLLWIDEASLNGPGTVRVSGSVNVPKTALDLAVTWEQIRWPLLGESQVDSPSGSLGLRGATDALAVDLDAMLGAATRLQADGILRGQAYELKAAWQDAQWPLRGDAALRSRRGELQADGNFESVNYRLDAALGARGNILASGSASAEQLVAKGQWTQLQWPMEIDAPELSSRSGQFALSGQPSDWAATINAEALVREQPLTASLKARGNLAQATLEELTLRGLGGSAEGNAVVDWGGKQKLSAALALKDLNPGALDPEWPGSLNGKANAEFDWHATPAWRVDWQLSESRLRDRELSSTGEASGSGERVSLQQLEARSGVSRLMASGQVLPQADLKLELDSRDLSDFLPGLSGEAQAQAALHGDWTLPVVELSGMLSAAKYQRYRIGSSNFRLQIDEQQRLSLQTEATELNLGYRFDRATISGSGTVADHEIRVQANGEDGSGEFQLRGGYAPQQQRWAGSLDGGQLSPVNFAQWRQEEATAISAGPGVADVDPVCWSGTDGRVCAQLHLSGASLRAAARLDALELAGLEPLLPPDWQASGTVTGSASFGLENGELVSARANFQSGSGSLRAGTQSKLQFESSELSLEETADGLRILASLGLSSGGFRLDANAQVSPRFADRKLSGKLLAEWPDISGLTLMSPELGEARGALSGEFVLAGSLGVPTLDGRMRLIDGEILLRTPNARIEALSVDLTADPQKGLQLHADGRMGEGQLSIDGTVDLTNARTEIRVIGDQLLAVNTAEARIKLSPDLLIKASDGLLQTSGQIAVPWARITPTRFDGGGIKVSADQVIVYDDAELKPVQDLQLFSDISLLVGDDVRFSGFGLETQLSGELRVRDEPGKQTVASGELRLLGGKYQAYGQDLVIETGRLVFGGGAISNPGLDLQAVRTPREDIRVGVQVRGPLRQPSLNIFSDPPMSNEHQLSWLVLGRGPESGSSSAEKEIIGDAALALGLKGSSYVAERFGKQLGLDEVSIGARPGESSDQAQFTIGKYLSPKLFVSYGVSLFQPGFSLRLNYDIGHGFALSTETGTQSGGDVIYIIER